MDSKQSKSQPWELAHGDDGHRSRSTTEARAARRKRAATARAANRAAGLTSDGRTKDGAS